MRKLKWMKRMAVVCLAATTLVSVTACGSSKNDEKGTESNQGKEDQLGEVQKGDTIATFHIKDYGDIVVRMFPKSAPKAVENFTTHAKQGYYDGVIFHRVINDFMIQGGDPQGIGIGGDSIWGGSFEDEFVDDLIPIRGALCMANSGANTNKSQFFIVQSKTANLDYASVELTAQQKQKFTENGGCTHLVNKHTVFGQVLEGMDVVDAIAATKTDASDRPVKDVVIESIDITEQE